MFKCCHREHVHCLVECYAVVLLLLRNSTCEDDQRLCSRKERLHFFLFVVSDTFFFRLQLADELLPRYNWIEFVRNMYMRWVMNKPMVMIIVDGQQQQQQHLTWTLHSLINALLCFFRKHQTIQPQNELNSKKVWFI